MSIIRTIANTNLLPLWRRRVHVWGFAFRAPTLDRLTALFLHKMRLIGRAEKLFFEKMLKPGMNVVDIGANQGLYALLFSQLVGESGTVIAFEPEPDMFDALENNILTNAIRNVQCHQLALGCESGEAMLSRSLIHAGDNRLSLVHSKEVSITKPVRLATLDEIVGELKIDFIKMDVQGWEGHVLRGMKQTLRRSPNIGIHFEFWPAGLLQAKVEPLSILHFFSEEGFQIYACEGENQAPILDFDALLRGIRGTAFINLYAGRTA
jgi:FkbM family methyltransferase